MRAGRTVSNTCLVEGARLAADTCTEMENAGWRVHDVTMLGFTDAGGVGGRKPRVLLVFHREID